MASTWTRDDVVAAVKAYGRWIEREADNIVGDNIETLLSGGLTVSFTVDRFNMPVVNVERQHICLEAADQAVFAAERTSDD